MYSFLVEHVMSLYWTLHQRLHRASHAPLKLAFYAGQRELALGELVSAFESHYT